MFEFMTIRELFELVRANNVMQLDGLQYVQLQGWVRTNRDNGSVGFIELNDGTYFKNCQLVYTPALANYEEISHCLTGTALTVVGKFNELQAKYGGESLFGQCGTSRHWCMFGASNGMWLWDSNRKRLIVQGG